MKITFITFHNWETKRIGGFHKLATGASTAGHEVLFFSFARPYFIALKHEERLNRDVLKKLSKGIEYTLDDQGHKLTNFTWPTLNIPNPLSKLVPRRINRWFRTHSLTPFAKIKKRYLDGTDVFVFESCDAIDIFDKIRKRYPNATIVYRPSDPMMTAKATKELVEAETHVLKCCDMTYIVNKAGLDLYRSRVSDFDNIVKYQMLPNGVNTELFKHTYPTPKDLSQPNTALYVGARVIEWPLIIEAAQEHPHINFVIVCPETPPDNFLHSGLKNIHYIPGIKPSEVPAWVTNCDVVIVPNPQGWYKIKPWGITAKYYQAMEAGKPIVVFEDTDELSEYGVSVAHDYKTFTTMLAKAFDDKSHITYEFRAKDWEDISKDFIESLDKLIASK